MRIKIMSAVGWLGLPLFYIPVAAAVIMANRAMGIKMAMALLLIEIIGGITKLAYPKKRPIPIPARTMAQKWDAGSFPSIHAARITGVAMFSYGLLNNTAFLALGLLLAVAVGYSRIHLKKHYPVDVLAGVVMGAVISWIILSV